MRLCIIGNSHIAALKQGWNRIHDEFDDFDIRFFGAPGYGLKDLVVVGNQIVANNEKLSEILRVTSEGEPIIDMENYDAFLFYGLGFKISPVDRRLSSAVVDAYCKEIVARNLSFRLIRKVQAVVKKPIYMGHIPLQACNEIIEHSSFIPYSDLSVRMSKALSVRNIILMHQPEKTVTQGIGTYLRFTKDSNRMKVSSKSSDALRHEEDDVKHMNEEFGVVYLNQALKTLRAENDGVQRLYSQ